MRCSSGRVWQLKHVDALERISEVLQRRTRWGAGGGGLRILLSSLIWSGDKGMWRPPSRTSLSWIAVPCAANVIR